ncbi:MAG: thioredoxin domain-containing protein [Phycisphaerales bacterium]|nr:thioredoxin domain-containing protein [Phycisphaerales bacterium]
MTTTQQPTHTNALANETSPYLLQHAHNPVDWHPWGDEAFAEARERNIPVFLSIGYSTCYWCHVMERESFENEEIAKIMNEHFVCIKVDREERPDIDDIYMAATTIFSGSGGWPMSVFLEPKSRKPFYAGTYFPAEPAYGRPSFPQLLEGLSDAWKNQNAQVLEQAESIAAAVIEQVASANQQPVAVGQAQLSSATSALLQRFDKTNGGFGGSPKFPQPVFLEYLLDFRQHTDDGTRDAIDKAIKVTLDAMAKGGINDQIGGGFHRYSTDALWTVPHFEKMLYDNAQLANVYARAASIYQDSYYARTARLTLDYCLREMTDQSEPGATGFFSAQDAEVDGKEGLNYLWIPEEINEVFGEGSKDAKFILDIYGLDNGTNFQDPHHKDEPPRNVLRLEERLDVLAKRSALSENEFYAKVDELNAKLYAVREQRKQPRLDDKVLTAWNGLLVSALVEAGETLDEPKYIEAAQHAADFILEHMRSKDGQLLRAYRANVAKVPAVLEDYAMLIAGMIKLHQAPLARNQTTIEMILELADQAHKLFADETGSYYVTRANQSDLFVRTRSYHDGAVPSAIGIMLHNLFNIASLVNASESDAIKYRTRAAKLLESISPSLASHPMSSINSARAMIHMLEQEDDYAGIYTFAGSGEVIESKPTNNSRVQVLVSTESITVTDEEPASFKIAIEIEEGYHIVAAEPGDSDAAKLLLPLRVGLTKGQGVAVYADYPEGHEYGLDSVGTFNINSGRIEFDVMIEKAPGVGPTPGAPVIGVSFQACNDSTCQAPQTVELDIEIVID